MQNYHGKPVYNCTKIDNIHLDGEFGDVITGLFCFWLYLSCLTWGEQGNELWASAAPQEEGDVQEDRVSNNDQTAAARSACHEGDGLRGDEIAESSDGTYFEVHVESSRMQEVDAGSCKFKVLTGGVAFREFRYGNCTIDCNPGAGQPYLDLLYQLRISESHL
ncbi:hypothetical protein ACEPPN_012025 [Leptodophora sp. 'Broadleaf-Isolate-01']